MVDRGASSWTVEIKRAAIGLFLGAAAGGALYLLLFEVGFAPLRLRPRLLNAWYAVMGWTTVMGGLAGWRGREARRAVERLLLPPEADGSWRTLLWLGLAFGLMAVLHYQVAAFLTRIPTDLPSFLLASRAMAAGADMYDPAVIITFNDPGETERWYAPQPYPFPYLYLPLFAVLLRPLSVLPLRTGYAAVLLINACLWPLLIYLCLRLIDPPAKIRGALALLVLLLVPSFFPSIFTLHHGSPSLLVAALVVGTLVLARSGRSRAAGLLLALAVLIKIVPVFLVAYLALRRRWRVLIAGAVAGAVLLGLSVAVAGLGPHLHWLTEMAPGLASGALTNTFFEPGCHPENQSLTGICCRLLGRDSQWYRPVSSLAGAVVVLLAGLVLWRRREPAIDRLEGSLAAVTLLLASTITWFHHMTLMLLPLLTLAQEAALRQGWRRTLLASLTLVVIFGVGFEFYLNPWTFVIPNPLTHSFRFLSLVLVYGTLLAILISERRRAARGSGGRPSGLT